MEVDQDVIPTARNYSEAEGHRLTKALLDDGRSFTAILAGNDLMALGCIDAINEAGLRCPEDVSVVGFNDMDWSHLAGGVLAHGKDELLAAGREAQVYLDQAITLIGEALALDPPPSTAWLSTRTAYERRDQLREVLAAYEADRERIGNLLARLDGAAVRSPAP